MTLVFARSGRGDAFAAAAVATAAAAAVASAGDRADGTTTKHTPVSLFRFSLPPLFLCFYRSISKTSFISLSLCYLPQIPPQTVAPRKK